MTQSAGASDPTERNDGRSPVIVSFTRRAWIWVLALCAAWTIGVSWLIRLPCHQLAWEGDIPQGGVCYSDIPYLYDRVGMVHGNFPYITPGALLEYPVLQSVIATTTGVFSWIITPVTSVHVAQSIYFDINAVTILLLWVTTVLAAGKMIKNPRAVLALALSPAVAATALINWDLWVVCATVLALFFMRREQWVLTGVFLGLGTALKLWPFVLLGVLICLGIRSRQVRPALVTVVSTVTTWLLVNLPFYLWDSEQWSFFWSFSSDRPAGFSSIYHVWNVAFAPALEMEPLGPETINVLAYGGFALLCVGILALSLLAPKAPSAEQLSLLIVAAFVLTNKVYSPQFVLWLVPLVILARPKVLQFLGWQIIEIFHWVSIFSWLQAVITSADSIPTWTWIYTIAVSMHVIAVVVICAAVVTDILRGRAPQDLDRAAAKVNPSSPEQAAAQPGGSSDSRSRQEGVAHG